MSSVRMCDKPECHRIFSENEEGWQTFTANTVEYDEDGRQITIPIRQDLCPECAVPTPRRGNKAGQKSETEKRIELLESNNKKLDELTDQINNLTTKEE